MTENHDSSPLRIGDIVVLNSFGPRMTVTALPPTSDHYWATCSWFGESGTPPQRQQFPRAALRRIQPGPGAPYDVVPRDILPADLWMATYVREYAHLRELPGHPIEEAIRAAMVAADAAVARMAKLAGVVEGLLASAE